MSEEIIKKIKKIREELPYTFVPVDKERYYKEFFVKKNSFNVSRKNLYNGYINCTINVINSLMVGNKTECNKNNEITIWPLEIENKIVISQHTLKSCIRNFLSAYMKAPIRKDFINERRYFFRPNLEPNTKNKLKRGIGYVEKIDGEGQNQEITISGVEDKNLLYSKKIYYKGLDGNYILKEKFDREKNKIKENTYEDLKKYVDKNKIDVDENKIGFVIKNSKYKEYKKYLDDFLKYHFKNHPLFKDNQSDIEKKEMEKIAEGIKKAKTINLNDVIFFEYFEDTKEIVSFGRTFYYIWGYKNKTNDIKEDIEFYEDLNKEDNKISILDQLFGISLKSEESDSERKINFSGKVHFNNALYESGGEKFCHKYPRPASPKPSAVEFYIDQTFDKSFLNTYGDEVLEHVGEKVKLSGRKFYKSVNKKLSEEDISEEYTVEIKNAVKYDQNYGYPKFRFKINFENLTEKELEYLVFALQIEKEKFEEIKNKGIENKEIENLKEHLYHQIGYGKNYGQGCIKIDIDDLKIIVFEENDFEEKEYSDFFDKEISDIFKNFEIDEELKKILKLYDEGDVSSIILRNGKIKSERSSELSYSRKNIIGFRRGEK